MIFPKTDADSITGNVPRPNNVINNMPEVTPPVESDPAIAI